MTGKILARWNAGMIFTGTAWNNGSCRRTYAPYARRRDCLHETKASVPSRLADLQHGFFFIFEPFEGEKKGPCGFCFWYASSLDSIHINSRKQKKKGKKFIMPSLCGGSYYIYFIFEWKSSLSRINIRLWKLNVFVWSFDVLLFYTVVCFLTIFICLSIYHSCLNALLLVTNLNIYQIKEIIWTKFTTPFVYDKMSTIWYSW